MFITFLKEGGGDLTLLMKFCLVQKKSILGGGFLGAGAWVLSRYYYEKDKRN